MQRPTEARAQAGWPKRVASVMLGGMALVILVGVLVGLARAFLGG